MPGVRAEAARPMDDPDTTTSPHPLHLDPRRMAHREFPTPVETLHSVRVYSIPLTERIHRARLTTPCP